MGIYCETVSPKVGIYCETVGIYCESVGIYCDLTNSYSLIVRSLCEADGPIRGANLKRIDNRRFMACPVFRPASQHRLFIGQNSGVLRTGIFQNAANATLGIHCLRMPIGRNTGKDACRCAGFAASA